MRHWKAALVIAAVSGLSLPVLADPTGTYSVSGINQQGGTYDGEVVVEPFGEVYDVTWSIHRDIFSGLGIADGDTFSVAYESATSVSGIIQMNRTDDGWDGIWGYIGQDQLGYETWSAQAGTSPAKPQTFTDTEDNPLTAASEQFILGSGYQLQDVAAVNGAIDQQLIPASADSVFLPSGRISPLVKAVLALEASEGVLERVRYRVLYGQQLVDAPPAANPVPVSFIQVDRFNLGPAIREQLINDIGAENVAPLAEFGEGPHVSWRLTMRPVRGHLADIVAATRREMSDADARGLLCLGTACLFTGSVVETAAPWSDVPPPSPASDPLYQASRDGLPTPAMAIDMLTGTFNLQPREGTETGKPFAEAVIEMNLGQDTSLDAAFRDGAQMDDSIRADWKRVSAFPSDSASPQFFGAEAFECQRGPVFPNPGDYCP